MLKLLGGILLSDSKRFKNQKKNRVGVETRETENGPKHTFDLRDTAQVCKLHRGCIGACPGPFKALSGAPSGAPQCLCFFAARPRWGLDECRNLGFPLKCLKILEHMLKLRWRILCSQMPKDSEIQKKFGGG